MPRANDCLQVKLKVYASSTNTISRTHRYSPNFDVKVFNYYCQHYVIKVFLFKKVGREILIGGFELQKIETAIHIKIPK